MREPEGDLDTSTEIRHLLRTVKTALELAIVARAPVDLINQLGRVGCRPIVYPCVADSLASPKVSAS